jgi:hypothetical protein
MVNLRYRVKGANKRARYQEMAAEDLITFDEPRARLAELDDIRSLAERELRALRNHEELVCKLEADRATLLESLVGVAQDALDSLMGEERHHVYRMLKLGAIVGPGEVLEVSGAFGEKFTMRNSRTPRATLSGRATPYPGARSTIRVSPQAAARVSGAATC